MNYIVDRQHNLKKNIIKTAIYLPPSIRIIQQQLLTHHNKSINQSVSVYNSLIMPPTKIKLTAQLINAIANEDQPQKVYKVNCTSMNIQKIQPSIKKYLKIRCLIMDFNFIQKIQCLNPLFDLRELHIEGNLLTKIQGLQTCKNLTVLNLAANSIQKIQGISHLNKLQHLNLSKNKLQKISQMQQLKQLKLLNLGYNNITSIDSLPAFSKLETLLLNNNNIKTINPQKMTNCQKIVRLDVSNNYLADAQFIGKLNNIESLNLGNNKIEKLCIDSPLRFLEEMNLEHNMLEQLPLVGEYFPQLVVLNISDNMFCSQHELITTLSDAQMLTELQFINNPITSTTFESTLHKLFSLDRINKKSYNQPGTKYLEQMHNIQETFVKEFAGLEDDEDDRKIKMSGFYNDELENKMTGIKPHRAVSPATKKARLLIANDYNEIEKSFKEFLQNDRRIKALREIYETICAQNNIEKPKIQPLEQNESNIYLTQGGSASGNEQNSFLTKEAIAELRLRNDNNEKLMKQTIKEKEERWSQLKVKTKEKSFNIRKSSRAKDMNGSLSKITTQLQKGKVQTELMKTQLIPGKLKQKLLDSKLKTGTLFYRPTSQK